jgi:hypothetical protein
MLLPRRFAAATALLLIAVGSFVLLSAASPAEAASAACADAPELTFLPSPLAPWKGAPLRIMVVSEKPIDGTLSLVAPDGSVAAKSSDRHGGAPYSWYTEVAAPAPGAWHATLTPDQASSGCSTITREIVVGAGKPVPLRAPPGSFWKVRNSWDSKTEALFSAWIEKLFDAPPDQDLSWKVWHEVLRDRSRNFLFNYLGLNEDKAQASLRPDCADFVYFLRAYFAYKMGLPFGYSNCSRGTGGRPPKCYQWFDVEHPEVTRPPPPPEQEIAAASPTLAAATPPASKPTFLGLFGHSQPAEASMPSPVPQVAPARPKPKRPTTFAEYLRDVGDVVHTGAVRVAANDDNSDFYTVPLTQQALRPGTVYADPYGHVLMLVHYVPEADGKPGVYLAVDAEPDGSITRKRFWRGNFLFVHDPALGSPGFKHFRPIVRGGGGGLRPARDFRLLIAIDVVRGFPDHVVRRQDRYALPPGESIQDVKNKLQSVLASELASRKISYTRSDGSQWMLSLKDVVDRAANFEMAYNPNDCAELRWGAPENSQEASTCKRHAPAAQRAKMSSDYRIWFHERHWPTHA